MRRMLRGTQGGGFEVEVPAINAALGGECHEDMVAHPRLRAFTAINAAQSGEYYTLSLLPPPMLSVPQ